jgi:hypothetical protein
MEGYSINVLDPCHITCSTSLSFAAHSYSFYLHGAAIPLLPPFFLFWLTTAHFGYLVLFDPCLSLMSCLKFCAHIG